MLYRASTLEKTTVADETILNANPAATETKAAEPVGATKQNPSQRRP
ncbi:hypothetical protein OHAE_4165 [Ochrobactrum soli]|uniref:Uncharacterized protein n=1 Tax=Ochrobactrum soli TaxID=2448455 RepID=A0A2P9HB78_9HYPH|nr:hypothetical protein OHAE_4165 [[Ochrobactrum] soli]